MLESCGHRAVDDHNAVAADDITDRIRLFFHMTFNPPIFILYLRHIYAERGEKIVFSRLLTMESL